MHASSTAVAADPVVGSVDIEYCRFETIAQAMKVDMCRSLRICGGFGIRWSSHKKASSAERCI